MGKTFAEKILAKNSGRAEVNPGDFLMIRPDVCASQRNLPGNRREGVAVSG